MHGSCVETSARADRVTCAKEHTPNLNLCSIFLAVSSYIFPFSHFCTLSLRRSPPCLQGDNRRQPPYQSSRAQTHPSCKTGRLISAIRSGVLVMAASMSYLQECGVLLGLWKSSKCSGRRGQSPQYRLFAGCSPIAAPRTAIEEDYAKRLAKLAKMTLGRDEIGLVTCLSYLQSVGDVCYPTPCVSTCVFMLLRVAGVCPPAPSINIYSMNIECRYHILSVSFLIF